MRLNSTSALFLANLYHSLEDLNESFNSLGLAMASCDLFKATRVDTLHDGDAAFF